MPFSQKLLNEDEEIVLDLHPHWWFMWKQALTLFVALVLGVVILANGLHNAVNAIAGIAILAGIGWFAYRYFEWVTTNFVVTTDRLIYRTGVLAKEGIEIPLDRVNTVLFSQSLFERFLRAGDLVIESAGEMGRQSFQDVRKPSAVQNEIYRQIEANENRKFDRIGGGVGGGTKLSVAEQIEKLDELRGRGVLSEDEFDEAKRKLLDG